MKFFWGLGVVALAGVVLASLLVERSPDVAYAPEVETARLANGLEIIVVPDARAPVVTQMLWYKVGSVHEPQGKSGLAHFFEHLMFRGTRADPEGEFSRRVARAGGRDNAFTSYDFTAYFQRIASDKLAQVMEQEAERMRGLLINPERVDIEREVILEERALRVDGNPSALLQEKIAAALFGETAYAVPIIGKRDEIAALSADDASAFYQQHYRPDNAVLVITGNTDLREVLELARGTYGAVESGAGEAMGAAYPLSGGGASGTQTIIYEDERVAQNIWRRVYRLPVFEGREKMGRGAVALDMLSEVLASGGQTRLHQKLVIEEKLATEIFAYGDVLRWGSGVFVLQATLAPDVDSGSAGEAITRIVDSEIARIVSESVSDDELETARLQLLSDALGARDSQHAMAYIYGQAGVFGLSPDDVAGWFAEVQEVGASDVADAARVLEGAGNVVGLLRSPE